MTAQSAQVHVSAPGKLMLLGEHAVVYQRPCLVTAVNARLHMTLAFTDDDRFTIHAPDVGIEQVQGPIAGAFAGGQALAQGTRFIESALAVFREHFGLDHGVQIVTRSDFSSKLGLGSSSATVACTLFGLANGLQIPLSRRDVFDLGLEAIFRVQQTGSGFDLASAVYGGTLYYNTLDPREIVSLAVPDLPLMTAYTGVKADTPTYVRRVKALLDTWPAAMHHIFDAMAEIVRAGRSALNTADWVSLGRLMDMQHGLAHAIGVDTPETVELVFRAREAGAYGAKLSGAGGGDCIIVLAPEHKRTDIEDTLRRSGGQIVPVLPNAPGVRIETEDGR